MITPNLANIIILSLLAGAATVIGAGLGMRTRKNNGSVVFGMTFAGIIMILVSCLELLPEAVTGAGYVPAIISFAAGAGLIIIFNLIIPHIHTIKEMEKCRGNCLARMPYLIALGLILHDFPEGIAITNSYYLTADLGILVAAALFIHNLPEGYILSVASPPGRRNHFRTAAWLSVASTVGGTILGIFILREFSWLNPALTAFAAGAMVYISVHELLPAVNRMHDRRHILFGALSALIIYLILGLIFGS
jgi:ZIP family zinc transporter